MRRSHEGGAPENRLQEADAPLALVARAGGALRLTAVDARAEAEGLHPGLSLADARARCPEVRVLEADPAADALALGRLAQACRRYTPALAMDPPDGIVLDMTGGAHLFGGEAALMADLRARVGGAGYAARLAMADTPGLAWALARVRSDAFAAPDFAAPVGAGAELLAPLGFAALRLPPDQLALLHRLGLRRIGQIDALPRAALARRLGRAFLDRLDEALGRRASPLTTELEVPPWRTERRLMDPIWMEDHVLAVIGDLAADLGVRLEGAGLGARRLVLELFRLDGAVRRLQVAASQPLRDPARIVSLFRERLAGLNEGLEADFGFDQLRLVAQGLQPLVPQAAQLTGEADRGADFAALADRLAARLGPDAVRAFADHPERRLPEEEASLQPYVRRPDRSGPAHTPKAQTPKARTPETRTPETRDPRFAGGPLRPLRLLQPPQPIEVLAELPDGPPERFRWRRVARRVVCAEGPERIEPEWWRRPPDADPGPRDYYRLEDEKGFRYWVFRQGLYSGDTPPRWYVQGLFA